MVNSTSQVGLPPIQQQSLGYTGSPLNYVPIVTGPRDPTGLDVNYPTGCEWTNTVTLAVWKLLGFTNGVAQWINISNGTVPPGTMTSLSDTVNTKTFPDGSGNIQLVAGTGIDITSNTPGANQMTIGLTGGAVALEKIAVDASTPPGSNPVVPSAGTITITGGQVAPATTSNVIQTDSLAANAFTIEIQQTSVAAAKNTNLNGVSHFNSAQFTNDQGFVSLTGLATGAIEGLVPQDHTAPGTSPVLPTGGDVFIDGAVVVAHLIPVQSNSIAANHLQIEVQNASDNATSDATMQGLASFSSHQFTCDANGWVNALPAQATAPTPLNMDLAGVAQFSDTQFTVDGDGFVQLIGGTSPATQGLIPDTGSNVTPDPATGLIKVETVNPSGTVNTSLPTQGIAAHTFGICAINCSKFIVDPTAGSGTHTTVAAALAAASSGDTIFIRNGTYTENISLKAGVYLTSFGGNAYKANSANVTILGTVTANFTGIVACFGMRFKTNGAAAIAASGVGSSDLVFANCTIQAEDATAITNSNSNCVITLRACEVGCAAGQACFNISAGFLTLKTSTVASNDSTANSVAGAFQLYQSECTVTVVTSGTGVVLAFNSVFRNAQNSTCITTAGTGTSQCSNCDFNSGTAECLSIGAGTILQLMCCSITTTNVNAVNGAGTLKYGYIVFGGASSTINAGVTKTALTVI